MFTPILAPYYNLLPSTHIFPKPGFNLYSYYSGTLFCMFKRNIALAGAGLLIVALLLYQVPAINSRLAWRFEVAKTYVKNVLNPVGSAPTAIPNTPVAA